MLENFLGVLDRQLTATSLESETVDRRHQIASELMATVEKLLRILALALPNGTTSVAVPDGTELGLAVWKDGDQSQEAVMLRHKKTQMELKWTAADGQKIEGFTLAGLLTYRGLRPVLNGARKVEDPQWETIGQDRWWMREPGHPSYRVLSEVVSAFVNDPNPQALGPSVNFTFSHQKLEPKEDQRILCAYWEPSIRLWATNGCTLLESEPSRTHCRCNHLTSFAVLMAFYEVESWSLDVITKVGLVLSLVCLLLSILTFLFCHAIKGPRTTIHLHLCLTLFAAYVLFLSGADRTSNQVACSVVAGLLHYFFLAAFCWMCLEGAELYLMVVRVFAPHSLKRRYMFLLGYGTPAVIVGISAAAYHQGYGTERHCWLSSENGFLWSFLAPVCIIIAVNAAIFVVTVWKLSQKFADINPDMSQLKKFRVLTITGIAQLCILGITWIFGLFQFSHRSLVVSYVFTILNTLQGLFIFLLHCLLKKQVREEYCRWLRCSSLPRKPSKYSEFSSSSATSTRGLQPSRESGL
uniref:Adhesion G protein-coupled receptor E5 n=1 Tax=Pelusios castaneus TaxID=367368 RepID=A0A8C8VLL0_9SAUR